jgi:glutamate-ammonia-ligase adenylyltransferase
VPANAEIESLVRELPDETAARLFLDRLQTEQPHAYQKLQRDSGLFADCLALAAWSPLLATTLEQNPSYLAWLARERADTRVRTTEQLRESLARFALTNSSLTPAILFARFRRRELLRIYLHDVRRAHSLVETTEELSNLADAILDYALSLAQQELDNRYGVPQRDEHGRIAPAEFCVVALGKLGSAELNYASDIDLLFIYSDDGATAGGSSERGKLTNREYFIKLSEAISKLVGHPAGEGAAYRVDLRLRPHGRDGALACSLAEALRYYRDTAQAWERQALIRSRAAAGSSTLFSRFSLAVEPSIYRADISVKDALGSVRLAKQKIDRNVARSNSGFNVKLQRGGIREIEFIAQALQLAHGARDEWLRVSHTLISLGRLADRNLIEEQERSELSEAYSFLRTLEHRLQMEHGLQTHTVPQAEAPRALVARRMGFSGETPRAALEDFERALLLHTANVRNAYDRVFAEPDSIPQTTTAEASFVGGLDAPALANVTARSADVVVETRLLQEAARVFVSHLSPAQRQKGSTESLTRQLRKVISEATNPQRALILTTRVAASLGKSDGSAELSEDALTGLVRLCGVSEFFGELMASNPLLVASLGGEQRRLRRRDYRALLRARVESEKSFAGELSCLRREWLRLLIEIGAEDAAGKISLREANELQTELAISSLNVAYLVARREMARRYGPLKGGPRLSVVALGRLASGGVDYGSDLDVTFVYDSLGSSPVESLTPDQAYSRLVELMIAALSSVTREGYLYRVDLRLRPNGKDGPLITSAESFLDYMRQRSAVWEWLAYVKLRAAAGDLELGKMVETHARHAVHERARAISPEELRQETRRVRERLEREKGRGAGHNGPVRGQRTGVAGSSRVDTKYAAGGMLDVYFAARYLQLRDDIPDEGDDRSTLATLARLEAGGSLTSRDHDALSSGYELLRAVDHQLRLVAGKVAALPAPGVPTYREIAERLGFASPSQLSATLGERMLAIREAYDRITGSA